MNRSLNCFLKLYTPIAYAAPCMLALDLRMEICRQSSAAGADTQASICLHCVPPALLVIPKGCYLAKQLQSCEVLLGLQRMALMLCYWCCSPKHSSF